MFFLVSKRLLDTIFFSDHLSHVAQGSKPWRYTGKEENMEREEIKMLVKNWWDIYEDESLDYKNALSNVIIGSEHVIQALTEANAVDHGSTSVPSAA